VIVRRGDFDDVEATDVGLHRDSAYGVEQFGDSSARPVRACRSRSRARVDDVDVDRQEDGITVARCDRDRFVENVVEPRDTISLISNERIPCSAIHASVAGSGQ